MSTTMKGTSLPASVDYDGRTWVPVSEGSHTYTDGKDVRNLNARGVPVLRADGNPGNAGGGRIADKVRLDATRGLENEVSRIAGLLKTMVSRAESEFESDGNLNNGLATMREIGRIANTLTSIGPGTKVTNVVENPQWVSWTREAMEEAGIDAALVSEALRLLEARLA